jgi:hypothetical protein
VRRQIRQEDLCRQAAEGYNGRKSQFLEEVSENRMGRGKIHGKRTIMKLSDAGVGISLELNVDKPPAGGQVRALGICC